MCGIAGWVDFARDLRREGAVVRAMTATMALRGPDAEGVWLDPHVGFGHRRLAVIDLPGGAQPMTAERDGRPVAVLTYSGEVYNFTELRAELRSRGHRFRTDSDTEVVLRAYLEWGESFVERLNGMYAFGLWDVERECLLLVRDRMGVKPLYYRPTDHGVVFGSEQKAILAHPEIDGVVDLDGLRELLTVVKTPRHAVHRGMYEVEPGELVRVDRTGCHRRRYWRLGTAEHRDDLDTTVGTVRELLEDVVSRQLVADVPLGVLLSGGLDSSVITAMAARTMERSGTGPVHSFAVDFVGQTDNFRPDPMRDTPDAPYVRAVAEHVKSAHTDVVLDSATLADPLYRSAVATACDLPTGLGDMYTSLYLLFRSVRAHSTVALSGEAADEVFGGYRWFHDPAVVATPTFPWLAAVQAMAGRDGDPLTGVLDPGLVATLDLDGYRQDAYRTALDEIEHLPGAAADERRMREVSYLHLTRMVQLLLDRKDRMSMAHGLEVRVPFCDHRLVEYVYNTPWSMKVFDGREKSLLRAAAGDLLPESVAQRRKSPYPSTQDPTYAHALREALAATVADPSAPVTGLLRADRVRELLDAPVEHSAFGPARRAIELVLGLDCWLRNSAVRLRLDG